MIGPKLPTILRGHLEKVLRGEEGISPDQLLAQDESLGVQGASFITLTQAGQLRGCIGTVQAHRSLARDLLDNAVAAATRDPRFSALRAEQLADVRIEVSLLTPPEPFPYRDGLDLLKRLQPGVHGVILRKGQRRATFLPQVWQQLPDAKTFLTHLCLKAGLMEGCWQEGVDILVYTVEKFLEEKSF
ncbi:MAG: AmmeMemoRadiSam system protein A [Magnetococcales bacterium]|nr:AmmeMemoRadiSam system protein A [Magnetococcales bacterium]